MCYQKILPLNCFLREKKSVYGYNKKTQKYSLQLKYNLIKIHILLHTKIKARIKKNLTMQ